MTATNINGTPSQATALKGYSVPGDVYYVVKSWFERKQFTASAAELLASALISTAIDNNGSKVDILELLKNYEGANTAEMQQFTAYLLNISRVNSSFVGYEAPMASNQVFARLVI